MNFVITVGHFLLVLSLAGKLLAQSAAPVEEKIVIAADPWCPYNCEPKSDRPGIMIEIAQRAAKKHNVEIDYKNMSWERAINEASNGRIDAIVGAEKGDAPDFVFPDTPLIDVVFCFYTNPKSTWIYKGETSLTSLKLGVIDGYKYGEFTPAIEKAKILNKKIEPLSFSDALSRNVKKVTLGRLDATIESFFVMNYFLKNQGKGTNLRKSTCSAKVPHYIAFTPEASQRKKSIEHARWISDEVKELQKSGEYDKILARY